MKKTVPDDQLRDTSVSIGMPSVLDCRNWGFAEVEMPRAIAPYLLAGLVLASAFSGLLVAQSPQCSHPAALIAPGDPAYADAMEMKQRLQSHGYIVECVFPTKLGSMFQVDENGVLRSTVEGEAAFRTNLGDIDVVFMPKPQTFVDFKITERRKDHGYLYRFTGTPRVLAGDRFNFGSAYRQCYLKFDNQLVFVSCTLYSRLADDLGHTPHLYFERMR